MGVAKLKKYYFFAGAGAGAAAGAGAGAAAGGFAAGAGAAAGGFAAGAGAGAWAEATLEANPNAKIDNNLFIYISYLREISLHG